MTHRCLLYRANSVRNVWPGGFNHGCAKLSLMNKFRSGYWTECLWREMKLNFVSILVVIMIWRVQDLASKMCQRRVLKACFRCNSPDSNRKTLLIQTQSALFSRIAEAQAAKRNHPMRINSATLINRAAQEYTSTPL